MRDHVAAVAVLLVTALALYGFRLAGTPPYFGGDEAHFANQGQALARHGTDLNGRSFPLFFNLADPAGDISNPDTARRWYQPTLFYLTAGVLLLAPVSEVSVRSVTVTIALVNISLAYVVGWQLFRNLRFAALTAAVLIVTPAHLIFARQATDYICILPYVLGWLACTLAAVKRHDWRFAALAGALLGAGLVSYIAAWILMPALVLLSSLTFSTWRQRVAVVAAFAVLAVPLLMWLMLHPEMVRDTFGRYGQPTGTSAFGAYASYWNPVFLFVRGGVNPTTATGRAGVFLVALAVLLLAGAVAVARWPRRVATALAGGVLIAPLPAALVGERFMIQRSFAMVPFAVVIATAGAQLLLEHSRRGVRVFAWLLLASMPVQFAYVYTDYLTHYRLRSAFYFDPHAFDAVTATVLAADAREPVPAVYLSRQLDDASARWRFHLAKNNRSELLLRTRYFDGDGLDLGHVPRGSLIVTTADGALVAALLATGKWTIVEQVKNIDRADAAMIFRKVI